MINTDVFVIGAGLAGLTLANELKQAEFDVCVAEKSRGSGGRLSSKRIQYEDKTIGFDLGSSAITAKTDVFKQLVANWQEQGVIEYWFSKKGAPHYVGTPRSSSITRYLADQVEVHFSTRVYSVVRINEGWQIMVESDQGPLLFAQAKHVVYASPAAQTLQLLPEHHEFKTVIAPVRMNCQWVLMLAMPKSLELDDLTLNATDKIQSISYENSKPNRDYGQDLHVYCVQASTDFSKKCIDHDPDSVKGALIKDLGNYLQKPLNPNTSYVHRWLYAQGSEHGHVDAGYLVGDDGIGICGDYLLGEMAVEGAEAAFLSGLALSNYLKNTNTDLNKAG